jgi:hypothetical protein
MPCVRVGSHPGAWRSAGTGWSSLLASCLDCLCSPIEGTTCSQTKNLGFVYHYFCICLSVIVVVF